MTTDTQPSSDQTLAVGDIGIITGSNYHPENVGRECIVIGPLDWYTARQTKTKILSYRVELDGRTFLVRPQFIRKRRPPSDNRQLVRWSECPWQPAGVRA